MRYVAYEDAGERVMGVVATSGVVPVMALDAFYGDVAAARQEATEALLRAGESVEGSGTTRAGGASHEPRALAGLALVPPVPTTARVLCLGLNYRAHVEESAAEVSGAPTVFGRFASTLACDGDEVRVPAGDDRLDWEGELAMVIGSRLESASEEEAAAAVVAYSCFNDLSARGYQNATSQWTLGKNADGTGPIGPVLVGAEDIPDPYDLHIETRVNGQVMQSASTGDMIFRAPEVLAYASGSMALLPGDVLVTGTPEGVGFTRNPPIYLRPGDLVEVEIERIGVLRNTIVS